MMVACTLSDKPPSYISCFINLIRSWRFLSDEEMEDEDPNIDAEDDDLLPDVVELPSPSFSSSSSLLLLLLLLWSNGGGGEGAPGSGGGEGAVCGVDVDDDEDDTLIDLRLGGGTVLVMVDDDANEGDDVRCMSFIDLVAISIIASTLTLPGADAISSSLHCTNAAIISSCCALDMVMSLSFAININSL